MDIDFTNHTIRMFSLVYTALLIVLGALVIRTDVVSKSIPNRVLALFTGIGVALYSMMYVIGWLGHDVFVMRYVQVAAVNSLFCLFVGFVIWTLNFWAPGDGKLFFVVSFFIPLKVYTYQMVPNFPSLILLVNIFLIAFVLLLGYTLILIIRHFIRLAASGGLSPQSLSRVLESARNKMSDNQAVLRTLSLFFYFASTFVIVRMVHMAVQSRIQFTSANLAVIAMVALYFSAQYLRRLLRNKYVMTFSFFLFTALIVIHYTVQGGKFDAEFLGLMGTSVCLMVFIPASRMLIQVYHESVDVLTCGQLEPGTALAEECVNKLNEEKNLDIPANKPLTHEQFQAIKDNFPNDMQLTRVTQFFFTPCIFLAILFTMVMKVTLISFIRSLL